MENTILPCFSTFYIAEHGISSRLLEYSTTRADLLAEIGTGHPILAICGHMDVVSPGELDQWHTDPFKLTNKDGKLYGHGATDMKSGLAALVIAMINIHEHDLIKHGSIRLLATFGW
ncbi:M20/M25/M40 family metallo-hydrolase [Lactobacillus crispatus]|jgi:succinyl-diaminopimelate desuccinylase|uniref:M20/M25/M40 family metallo-hydrolase n=1 Tax=Lactobacillus crispatus TaxID=47770 RepID=UPI001CC317CD|nr:M20/M25/M40 family metallo-hydrolase [Lactobacillus crispatus]